MVDEFFFAALRAGGRIRGEPAVRDFEAGYYSAAILDFDNNTIEVVHRDKSIHEKPPPAMELSENSRVMMWQKEVAESTISKEPALRRSKEKIVVTNVSNPTVVVTRSSPVRTSSGDSTTKALVGTLLGAAAGAAFAYAMTRSETDPNEVQKTTVETYRAGEVSPPSLTRSASAQQPYVTTEIARSPRTVLKELEYPRTQVSVDAKSRHSDRSQAKQSAPPETVEAPLPVTRQSTLIDTSVPPSEVLRFARRSLIRSNTDGTLPLIREPQEVNVRPRSSARTSRASSARTITPADFSAPLKSTRPSAITELRAAKDIPLASSEATSRTSQRDLSSRPAVKKTEDLLSLLEMRSVTPSDSVSQVGSSGSRTGRCAGRRRSSRIGSRSRSRSSASQRDESNGRGGETGSYGILPPPRPTSRLSVH